MWLEKLLEKTSYVRQLKRNLSYADKQYEKLIFKYEELCKSLSLRDEYIKNNKKHTRKIYKLTKDKDIRKLCNKILKGEN